MNDDVAIRVDDVVKDFKLPHDKASSLKSVFTGLVRGNRGYDLQHALRGVSFEVKKGEFFGIVGRNGSGKSTLLKILAGIYQANKGNVAVSGKLVPFIELGVGFNPELTGRENVYMNGAMLGFSEKEVDAIYDDIVAFAELERFMDQKLKNYSSGMQVRLAFSMAIRADADILLIDEVLAVGDADFQRKCFEYFKSIKKSKKTVVFVGHNMDVIREYCDRGVFINDGKIEAEGGSDVIATAYTKLFIEKNRNAPEDAEAGGRSGSLKVEFTKVETTPAKTVEDKDRQIKLQTDLVAHEDCDDVVIGFKVKNGAGNLLFGTNTKLLGHQINLKSGQKLSLNWSFPHILNDGKFTFDVAIESSSGETFDWWEDALTLNSLRQERTGFAVAPEFKLEIDRK
ncbi:MAG TPA: ABC transporter ATP-binding protein [Candidatus Saccharimonadales bacterium]|nr:ABC transporter ATP-binding protein [Candidatus Saccharimonadales bacterium]